MKNVRALVLGAVGVAAGLVVLSATAAWARPPELICDGVPRAVFGTQNSPVNNVLVLGDTADTMQVGDQLSVSVDYQAGSSFGGQVLFAGITGAGQSLPAGGLQPTGPAYAAGEQGTMSFGPYRIEQNSDRVTFEVGAYTSPAVEDHDFTVTTITVTCTLAAQVAGPLDIQYMQDGIVRHATLNAAQMLTDLVNGGVDAAFDAQAAQQGTALGYTAGTVVLDSTPDALKGSGVSLWSGLKYGLTPGGRDQWSGMQLSGAAGINFNVSDAFVVGAFGGYEAGGYKLASAGQGFTGSGGSAGLVAAYRLDDDWRIETSGSVSLLNYDLDAAGTKAKFGAIRYVLNESLTGRMPLNATIDFVPVASVSVVKEDQAAYTDSASGTHAADSIYAARGSAGGEFVLYPTDGLVTYSAGGYADYWAGDAFGDGLSGRVEVGTDIGVGDTGTIGLKGSVGNLGASSPLTFAANAHAGGGF